RAVMADAGSALMGIGVGSGKSRAREAAIAAISSPLLETSIDGATGAVLNITGGNDMTLHEVNAAAEIIYEAVDPNANIIFGAVIDERMQGEVRITVIATGFNAISEFGSGTTTATSAPSRIAPLKRPSSISSTPSDLPGVPSNRPSISPDLDIPDFLQRRRQSR
ncbi:MAG: cell division protein FtsZ, partial [Cyanobacteria bacterium P01_H01_bin.21]